jgi:predicted O-methyltransferase YrrM
MGTPLIKRVKLKIRMLVRDFDPAERRFRRVWPLIDPIEGFLAEAEAQWLFNAALQAPDGSNFVEVGSYKGRSTCSLALGCRGTNKRVFAVDPFDGGPDLPKADSLREFSQNLRRCRVSEHVEPIVGVSVEVSKSWNEPIQLLFVDGSHKYEDVLADFAGFFPHVVPGGIVAFHDVIETWPGVLRAWNDTVVHELTDVGHCWGIGYGRKAKHSRTV